jgi:hypothetical protein
MGFHRSDTRFCAALAAIGIFILLGSAKRCRAEDEPRNDTDPMAARIAPPGDIADPLSEEDYKTRFAKALQDAGPVPSADQLVLTGVRILSVEPGGAAENASLHAGDVIISLNDKPTPTIAKLAALLKAADGDVSFEILPADQSARRKVTVAAGPPGIIAENAWIAESQYLQSLAADAKPVDEIRIAARCALTDPQLAESALAHAQKNKAAGIDGEIFDTIAAMAFHGDSSFESALSYGTVARKTIPAGAAAMLNRICFESAYATFRYPVAKELAKNDARYQEVLPGISDAIDVYQQLNHTAAELNPAASKIAFTDQSKNLINTAPNRNNEAHSSGTRIASFIANGVIGFSSPGGKYTVCRCGPGDTNIDFSADCHFAATDHNPTRYVRVLRVGVETDGPLARTLEIYTDGSANITTDREIPVPRLDLKRLIDKDRKFNLKMTIVGDRYEFTIDGKRIFYGPMPSAEARSLRLSIQTVGITGQFSNAHWSTAPAQ